MQNRDSYLIWVGSSLLLLMIAVSCIQFISPLAEGSGIPQMKAILKGVQVPGMLSFKTLISKSVGITAILCSGMSVGKQGPFVHIAGCIANLTYQQMEENENKTVMHHYLFSAVAIGVIMAFGTPLAGIIMAIEVTAYQCTTLNIYKAYYCSVIVAIWFTITGTQQLVAIFREGAPYFYEGNVQYGLDQELLHFILLGVVCGWMGSHYIWYQKKVNTFRKESELWIIKSNWTYPLIVGWLILSLTYFTGLL